MKRFCVLLLAAFMCGCHTQEQIDAVNAVISTSKDQVGKCTYLGRPWTRGNLTLNASRFDLKLMVSKLGGTHLVETNAYPYDMRDDEIGKGLAGEAYRCEKGTAPTADDESSKLKDEDIFPPMPQRRHRHHDECFSPVRCLLD